jgi:hypothetical protein
MNDLLKILNDIKKKEAELKKDREAIEVTLYELVMGELPEDGQKSFKTDSFKFTVKHNYAVKVDQELAKEQPESFKWKAEMSYSQYKKTNGLVDNIVTVSMNKPTFTLEVLDVQD